MKPTGTNNHPRHDLSIAENVARDVTMSSIELLVLVNQARFTPKGMQWVAGLWASYQMEAAA